MSNSIGFINGLRNLSQEPAPYRTKKRVVLCADTGLLYEMPSSRVASECLSLSGRNVLSILTYTLFHLSLRVWNIMEKKDPLISFIVEERILDEKSLEEVIRQHQDTGQSLVSILKKENLLDEDQLTKVVAGANKIEFINLAPEMVDPMVAHLVPYEIASRHNVIPIKKEDNQLQVAMSSPLNVSIRDQIEMKTGY